MRKLRFWEHKHHTAGVWTAESGPGLSVCKVHPAPFQDAFLSYLRCGTETQTLHYMNTFPYVHTPHMHIHTHADMKITSAVYWRIQGITNGAIISQKLGNNHASVLELGFYGFSFISDYNPYVSRTGFGIHRGERLLSSHSHFERAVIYICKLIKVCDLRWGGRSPWNWGRSKTHLKRNWNTHFRTGRIMVNGWILKIKDIHAYLWREVELKYSFKRVKSPEPFPSLLKQVWWELHETSEAPCPAPTQHGGILGKWCIS